MIMHLYLLALAYYAVSLNSSHQSCLLLAFITHGWTSSFVYEYSYSSSICFAPLHGDGGNSRWFPWSKRGSLISVQSNVICLFFQDIRPACRIKNCVLICSRMVRFSYHLSLWAVRYGRSGGILDRIVQLKIREIKMNHAILVFSNIEAII
jgi:hypothetical protein